MKEKLFAEWLARDMGDAFVESIVLEKNIDGNYSQGMTRIKFNAFCAGLESLPVLEGEPVAWQSAAKGDVSKARLYFDKEEVLLPLYNHPPAPLEMLDDDEWTELWIECSDENGSGAEIEMSLFSEKVQQAFCAKNNLTLEKL